jgi:hypothetical protein
VVFLLTCLATLGGSAWLCDGVRSRSRPEIVAGLLVLGLTYTAVVLGHHDRPWTAGVAGLALLGLAHLAHSELDRSRRLPTEPGAWPWRVTLALTLSCVLLDALVAVVSGGGRPHPGSPSPLSVLVGCLVVAGVVTALTALADGVSLPARGDVPDLTNPAEDRLPLTLGG